MPSSLALFAISVLASKCSSFRAPGMVTMDDGEDGHRTAVTVQVYAEDPISREGVRGQLRNRGDVDVLPDDGSTPDVRIIAIDRLDESGAGTARRFRAQG